MAVRVPDPVACLSFQEELFYTRVPEVTRQPIFRAPNTSTVMCLQTSFSDWCMPSDNFFVRISRRLFLSTSITLSGNTSNSLESLMALQASQVSVKQWESARYCRQFCSARCRLVAAMHSQLDWNGKPLQEILDMNQFNVHQEITLTIACWDCNETNSRTWNISAEATGSRERPIYYLKRNLALSSMASGISCFPWWQHGLEERLIRMHRS